VKKQSKLPTIALCDGPNHLINLPLEFEGKRAFVVWDSIQVRGFELKARIELNPRLLKKVACRAWDYLYDGMLPLPRPQNN
jgi:hypothetical protein